MSKEEFLRLATKGFIIMFFIAIPFFFYPKYMLIILIAGMGIYIIAGACVLMGMLWEVFINED